MSPANSPLSKRQRVSGSLDPESRAELQTEVNLRNLELQRDAAATKKHATTTQYTQMNANYVARLLLPAQSMHMKLPTEAISALCPQKWGTLQHPPLEGLALYDPLVVQKFLQCTDFWGPESTATVCCNHQLASRF